MISPIRSRKVVDEDGGVDGSRPELLAAAGHWPEAETELHTALELYDRSYRLTSSRSWG